MTENSPAHTARRFPPVSMGHQIKLSSLKFFLFICTGCNVFGSMDRVLKPWIVILDKPSFFDYKSSFRPSELTSVRNSFVKTVQQHHKKLVAKVLNRDVDDSSWTNTYSEIYNGFSLDMTDEEASILADHADVLHVAEDSTLVVHTTRSYSYLGLDNPKTGAWKQTTASNVIIGVVDTGIWPEDSSFSDSGYGAVPKKFKGVCQGPNFKCNKKVIGARFFGSGAAQNQKLTLAQFAAQCGEFASPRDSYGHGSITSSISSGVSVPNIKVGSTYVGTSKGIAFSARIAVYKAFWCGGSGQMSDIAMALDKAVSDGVDILSLSFGAGPEFPGNFTSSLMYYFTFKAVSSQVPVIFSAGNNGPYPYTVGSSAPWAITVTSGSLDRRFSSTIVLANGIKFEGYAVNNPGTPKASKKQLYTFINEEDASIDQSSGGRDNAVGCLPGSLDSKRVKNKILICEASASYAAITLAGIIDTMDPILVVFYEMDSIFPDLSAVILNWPAVVLTRAEGLRLKTYASSKKQEGYVLPTTIFTGSGSVEAPAVDSISSQGPNGGSRYILKPDILAPGKDIIGAWSQNGSVLQWNVGTGTSLACPQVTGVVALLKSIHPSWNPSMYYSAITTTAKQLTNFGNAIKAVDQLGNSVHASPFQMGAGALNPNSAVDPGLVYNVWKGGYNPYLCSKESGIRTKNSLFKVSTFCPGNTGITQPIDVNLPSITFFDVPAGKTVSVKRTLWNVGPAGTYFLTIKQPTGYTIAVNPTKLTFLKGQSLAYAVTFSPKKATSAVKGALNTPSSAVAGTIGADDWWSFGSITWYDNKGHSVRSPVIVNVV